MASAEHFMRVIRYGWRDVAADTTKLVLGLLFGIAFAIAAIMQFEAIEQAWQLGSGITALVVFGPLAFACNAAGRFIGVVVQFVRRGRGNHV